MTVNIMLTLPDDMGASLDAERGNTPQATYAAACVWRALRRTKSGARLLPLPGPGRPRKAVEPEPATKRPATRKAAKKRTKGIK